jgi:RNA polymerase sigma factor (sigma-70 family)
VRRMILVSTQQLEAFTDRAAADVDEIAVAQLEAERLRHAVRRLDPLQARVVIWRYGLAVGAESPAPLSHRQIAKILGRSVGTVFNIEQRALRALRVSYGLAEAA